MQGNHKQRSAPLRRDWVPEADKDTNANQSLSARPYSDSIAWQYVSASFPSVTQ
jgi:hypothetical protein